MNITDKIEKHLNEKINSRKISKEISNMEKRLDDFEELVTDYENKLIDSGEEGLDYNVLNGIMKSKKELLKFLDRLKREIL